MTSIRMVSDKIVQQMADQRERIEDQRIAEESRRQRQHRQNLKVMASLEGKAINPTLLNRCCGNVPSVGVRKGKPYVYCCWCKRRVDHDTPAGAVESWNNPKKESSNGTKGE